MAVNINRLGLGCMGMSSWRNREDSIKTIHKALECGVTLFNTGEFYNSGESEMVVGEALRGVDRDSYFLSVKFGVLRQPGGGIYGLDVNPFNVKGHLAYSLSRLGMDYVDLYQPARMDSEIPVEEIVGEIAKCVQAGYVRHIGLTTVDAETLRRAHKVHPIHTVEMSYSLIDRKIEEELIDTAEELGVKVLAFGTIGHGLFADNALENNNPCMARGLLSGEHAEKNLETIRAMKEFAETKGMSLSQIALLWSLSKYDNVLSLVGTANPAHLQSAVDALGFNLTKDDIKTLEEIVSADKISGRIMRDFKFVNGRMSIN